MNILPLLLTVVISMVPVDSVVRDTVDLIEVNHVYDDRGRLVLQQVIFWDWHADRGRFHVVAWRMLRETGQIPRRDWQQDDYFCLWYDGDVLREVRAPSRSETWTQFDPELDDRQELPRSLRRKLSGEPQGDKVTR